MSLEKDEACDCRNRAGFSVKKEASHWSSLILLFALVFVLASSSAVVLLSSREKGSNDSNKAEILNVNAATVVFTSSANATTPALVGDEVTFWAYAESTVGADLTFTIYFDYWLSYSPNPIIINPSGGYTVNVTTSPGKVLVTHIYDHAGNITYPAGTCFLARMTVTDGFSTVTKGPLAVYVIGNQPPYVSYSLPSPIIVDRGVPSDLWTNVTDPDNDSVDVTWDFGDGSPNGTNNTGPAKIEVQLYQNHTWNPYVPPGMGYPYLSDIYETLTLTLDDGMGHVNVTTYQVDIRIPRNSPPGASVSGPASVDLGTLAFYNASAIDVEGEDLTWTFDYGDGILDVFYTTGVVNTTVWTNVTHLFSSTGTYTVVVYVTDRLVGSQEFPHNVTASVSTKVIVNQPPGGLENIVVIPEANLIINASTGLANGTMYIEANDFDGDVLTAVWDFGDGSPAIVNTSAGGTGSYRFAVEHGYSAAGQYNVSVTVTDGRVGHEFTRYVLINVTSSNQPPVIVGSSLRYPEGRGNYAEANETVAISLILKDHENNVLNFTVDFGDGSPLAYFSISAYDAEGNLTFVVEHSYSAYGVYTVQVNITDGIKGIGVHNISVSFTITVKAAPVVSENPWNWWDSVSLGLFLMIPVIMVLWLIVAKRHQRILDNAGMTYEQWLTRKSEIKEELKTRKI